LGAGPHGLLRERPDWLGRLRVTNGADPVPAGLRHVTSRSRSEQRQLGKYFAGAAMGSPSLSTYRVDRAPHESRRYSASMMP
jgi:hypothetical protein